MTNRTKIFERIRITTDAEYVYVLAPYHSDFVALGQEFSPMFTGEWIFNIRDENAVREIVKRVYGTDGSEPVTVCDVQMVVNKKIGARQNLFALGRYIATRSTRGWKVELGENVTILSGSFAPQCGTLSRPLITVFEQPVVLLVSDVPVALANHAVADDPETYHIINEAI